MTADAVESDGHLISAARRGERAAFNELVTRHKALTYRLIRRYIGDADEAYDVLQETFVAAWLALSRFDPQQPFAPWLRAIALNKCRDHARRASVRIRMLTLFARDPTSPGRTGPVGSEQGSSEPSERRQRLDQAISRLPSKYKEPLLLTLVSGLSQREAAEELGLTEKAVEMRIRRAKRHLLAALAEDPTREG
ncbi:MAG TPA: RNA polymerase sigma factor [Steroidobacteraceae bacterium]|nr:RNA polymerase sigma factor [Steroidobacteraceae bacterium]